MRSWLSRSLKHKLSVMLLFSILVPVISLGFFSYHIASRLSEEQATMSGMNTLRQLSTQLELMVTDVESMSLSLIGDEEIQRYLQRSGYDARQRTSIINFLTNFVFFKKHIANITIITNNGKPSISYPEIFETEFEGIEGYDSDGYNETKWWSPPLENKTSAGTQRVMISARPIRSTKGFETVGTMQIGLDVDYISNNVRQAEMEGEGYVLLLNEDGRVISGPTDAWLNRPIADAFPEMAPMNGSSGSFNHGQGDEKSTILYYRMPQVNWTLVGVIPFKEYRSQNRYVLALTSLAVGIAMVMIIALVLFLIQRVTRPLSLLTKYLKNVSPEEPLPKLPTRTTDEVGQLIVNYNKLSHKIQMLTHQVKQNESLKKKADFIALQAQINPHFLYNTLSSVHWLALMSKDAKIAKMVGALNQFLRFSLNKGKEFYTVQQEISHAENYVDIQSIRFPDKFDFRVYVDEDIKTNKMLKLILQPLIENAMIHGIQKKEGKGTITVYAEGRHRQMTFTVKDDGVGIDEQKLNDLRIQIRESEHAQNALLGSDGYGLRNVHRRLTLHYGSSAGLIIESKKGEGTSVSFTIPIMKDEQE